MPKYPQAEVGGGAKGTNLQDPKMRRDPGALLVIIFKIMILLLSHQLKQGFCKQ